MTFEEFFEVYKKDRKPRIRLNTWKTKESIIVHKVMPYLGKLKINEITSVTIIQWQNTLMEIEDDQGNKYSQTYLRTIHAQLSSVLNHACRYYNLPNNAARDVGTMGEKEAGNHALRRPVARANKTTRAHERSHCRAPLINSFKIEHTSIELNCRQ